MDPRIREDDSWTWKTEGRNRTLFEKQRGSISSRRFAVCLQNCDEGHPAIVVVIWNCSVNTRGSAGNKTERKRRIPYVQDMGGFVRARLRSRVRVRTLRLGSPHRDALRRPGSRGADRHRGGAGPVLHMCRKAV